MFDFTTSITLNKRYLNKLTGMTLNILILRRLKKIMYKEKLVEPFKLVKMKPISSFCERCLLKEFLAILFLMKLLEKTISYRLKFKRLISIYPCFYDSKRSIEILQVFF